MAEAAWFDRQNTVSVSHTLKCELVLVIRGRKTDQGVDPSTVARNA
jgi:hypothetical protein